MQQSLKGKSALVTGGSRGIGSAIVHLLGENGANVAFSYQHSTDKAAETAARLESAGLRSAAFRADHTSVEASVEAVKLTAEQFGKIDILVHNAGVFSYGEPESHSIEEVDRLISIHIRSVFIATQAALRFIPEGGRIVFIGSSLAERVPAPGLSLYAMTKASLSGLAKGLARDLGPRGITVNVVHPGSTNTDMNPADGPGSDAERTTIALGRYGEPIDIANAVLYLASNGGRHVTGSNLVVDGGANA